MKIFKKVLLLSGVLLLNTVSLFASEADLAIPDLHNGAPYSLLGGITPFNLLMYGACIIAGTLGISLYLSHSVKKEDAHSSMLNVADIIYTTCKTYLIQQGKFLLMLFAFIGSAMAFYFLHLKDRQQGHSSSFSFFL